MRGSRREVRTAVTREDLYNAVYKTVGRTRLESVALVELVLKEITDCLERGEAVKVAQSAKIEAGHVHVPKNAEWTDTFLLELLGFPNGRHDDQVDSVSQFLKWAAVRKFLDDFDIGMPLSVPNYQPSWFCEERPYSSH